MLWNESFNFCFQQFFFENLNLFSNLVRCIVEAFNINFFWGMDQQTIFVYKLIDEYVRNREDIGQAIASK